MKELARNARTASTQIMSMPSETRRKVLNAMADKLDEKKAQIVAANQIDLELAKKSNLSSAMLDRLTLTEDRIDGMIKGVREINNQEEVVNKFYDEKTNESGLNIVKQRIPLGVILMIFESRPNVVVDCAALAIKSSNAIILKGGKEAKHSNEILGSIIREAIKDFIPVNTVQVLASDRREDVQELLSFNDEIDVVVPRGGEGLIKSVYENAKMPVIAHFRGLCHMYIDEAADKNKVIDLVLNGKTQRPGVCNAIETLLIHKDIADEVTSEILKQLQEKGTELRVDEKIKKYSNQDLKLASEQDWDTEYLDNVLSIKMVDSLDHAIEHINRYGTQHTECIISENLMTCNKFINSIDASCIMVNASTRFNDGSQLGLGAELGISTTKLHAYGPMGAEQMTTSRYVVMGSGQTRT